MHGDGVVESNEIIEKYQQRLMQLKIVSVLLVLLSIPKLALFLTDQTAIFGITKNISLAMFSVGTLVYVYFGLVLYKCPKCHKSPGAGWSKEQCNSCQVQLKRT